MKTESLPMSGWPGDDAGKASPSLPPWLELLPLPLAIWRRDGRMLGVNRRFVDLFGYTLDDIPTGEAWLERAYPDEEYRRQLVTRWQADTAAAAEGGGDVARHESRVTCKDGSVRWVEVHAGIIGDCVTFVYGDLTERRRLEEQLLQAQKMEAMGRLAGGVAHDFNNLLHVITGYAEDLEHGLGLSDSRREETSEIRKAAQRAAHLTRQLLAFSRRQEADPRLVVLGELVASAEKMLRRLIGEDIALVVEGCENEWVVFADPGHLEQVLLNLAVNARDAMPSGGRLTISVTRERVSSKRTESCVQLPPGDYVLLTVSDTGFGMSEETQAHVFEPFFSTKPAGQGTGLGLSTVYGVVQQAAGHISVTSAPGRGSVFRIYLPEVKDLAAKTVVPEPPVERPNASETILVVEDEPMVARLVEHMLTTAGYRVLLPSSPGEALRLAAEHDGPIHLVLTDVIMPGLGGLALWEHITQLRHEARVLFMSGYTDEFLGDRDLNRTGAELLRKPFRRVELLSAVGRVLAGQPERH